MLQKRGPVIETAKFEPMDRPIVTVLVDDVFDELPLFTA